MLESYPKFKKGQVEKIFKNLNKNQKEELESLLLYRSGRGLKGDKLKDLRRWLLQLYYIIGGTFKNKISNETEAIKLSLLIQNSHYSKETKPNILINTANILKHIYSDWAIRFKEFEMFSVKQFNKGDESEPKDYDLIKDEEIKKIYRTEESLFWKCFFKVLEQTGLRIKEARTIVNTKIEFNEDGTATIEIFMTKTGKKKFVFCDTETAELIKKIQEEQKNTGDNGKYLFHSPKDGKKPISKNQVCFWFRKLTLKAIGRKCIPYQLRHRRATILYKLSKENKISKDTCMELLGHGRDMSEKYTHITDAERKKILKEQAFRLEMPEEKKHELENKIEILEKQLKSFEKENKEIKTSLEVLEHLKENWGILLADLKRTGKSLKYQELKAVKK
jgi:integrase